MDRYLDFYRKHPKRVSIDFFYFFFLFFFGAICGSWSAIDVDTSLFFLDGSIRKPLGLIFYLVVLGIMRWGWA